MGTDMSQCISPSWHEVEDCLPYAYRQPAVPIRSGKLVFYPQVMSETAPRDGVGSTYREAVNKYLTTFEGTPRIAPVREVVWAAVCCRRDITVLTARRHAP